VPRDFRYLYVANLISNLGSWLLVVALPYHVFRASGSITATGLTLAAESLPALAVGPFAGRLVDRLDRRLVMIVSNIVCAGAVVGLLAGLPWLYLAVIAENVGLVFFRPAARAMLPAIAGTGPTLVRANSRIAFNNGLVRLLGPPLGAVLGMPLVVWSDVGSYAVSASLITLVASNPLTGAGDAGFGLRYTWQKLRRLLLVNTVFFTANGVYTALLVPFMTRRFGQHPADIGVFFSALGVGYLIGAPIAGRLVKRHPASPLLRVSQLGIGACFLLLAHASTVVVAIAAGGMIGLPGSLLLVTIETTIQRSSADELRGRVGATFFASDALALLLGSIIAALAGPWILTVAAGVILVSGLVL